MSRSVIATVAAAVVLTTATPVAAQEPVQASQPVDLAAVTTPVLDSWAYERPSSAPNALKALYGSYGVLQGLDLYSTSVALKAGAHEMNPVMNGGAAAAAAVKAAMSLTTYYAVHRMAKKNRKGAIVTMAILNGITATVVANNLKNSRR
jgi:hypothetical protein